MAAAPPGAKDAIAREGRPVGGSYCVLSVDDDGTRGVVVTAYDSEALSEVFGICDQTDWARLRAFGFSEEFLVQLRIKALPDCAAAFEVDTEAGEAEPAAAADQAAPTEPIAP